MKYKEKKEKKVRQRVKILKPELFSENIQKLLMKKCYFTFDFEVDDMLYYKLENEDGIFIKVPAHAVEIINKTQPKKDKE
jgi:hypothetical protein|tara:strand:- start:5735 stop:5974 length:240 start_codon:yes stop_codon:yes gene_type:complete